MSTHIFLDGLPVDRKVESAPRCFFVVAGDPVSKPRQTRSDKWKERPIVLRYRAWADHARRSVARGSGMGVLPEDPRRLDVIAYFMRPQTWSRAKRAAMSGQPHTVRPDGDNCIKAVADALYPCDDSMIHEMRIKKLYDDGNGPRVEITIY